jgi:hypothetical protein
LGTGTASSPKDNPEGLSITHLEFRRAGQKGKPRIALLSTSILNISLSDVSDPPSLALVQAFRAEVTDALRAAEFHDKGSLLQGLSIGVQAELEERAGQADGPWAGGPVLRLAPRLPLLAGREELLADLDDRFTGAAGRGPQVVALTGLGGADKTSVAVEYAHRHLDQVEVAWQLPAENATVLAAGFTDLAAELGTGAAAGGGDPVAGVHSALAAYPGAWLLIFDNAQDATVVEPFLPPAGRGRVLITSRSALWPAGQAVEVPVLGAEVAADYLVRLTEDADRGSALELAGELGGLPLALEQAAAYIRASASSLARYLVLLRQRRPDLLARGEADGSGKTVATTWSLAFTQLEGSAPAAVGLLRLLACCAPEAIPFRLLLQPRPGLADDLSGDVAAALMPLLEDEMEADAAVRALRPYSLVTPAEDGVVSVHRLVQAVTLAQVRADVAGQWKQAAAALIEAAIPADTDLPANWPVCAPLLPHARAVLGLTSGGMQRIADYLGKSGSYPAARDLFQLIADAYAQDDAHGPENRDTLVARANLAHWTGEAGDAAGARDQFAGLLPTDERVLGTDDRQTLADRGSLARWTGEAGDAARACRVDLGFGLM